MKASSVRPRKRSRSAVKADSRSRSPSSTHRRRAALPAVQDTKSLQVTSFKGASANGEATSAADSATSAAREVGRTADNKQPSLWSSARIVSFHDVRSSEFAWLADNEALTTGYRVGHDCAEALKSLFRLHVDTVNVWTHLCGAVVFLILLLHFILYGVSDVTSLQVLRSTEVSPAQSGRFQEVQLASRLHAGVQASRGAACDLHAAACSAVAPAAHDVAAGEGTAARCSVVDDAPVAAALQHFACSVEELKHSAAWLAAGAPSGQTADPAGGSTGGSPADGDGHADEAASTGRSSDSAGTAQAATHQVLTALAGELHEASDSASALLASARAESRGNGDSPGTVEAATASATAEAAAASEGRNGDHAYASAAERLLEGVHGRLAQLRALADVIGDSIGDEVRLIGDEVRSTSGAAQRRILEVLGPLVQKAVQASERISRAAHDAAAASLLRVAGAGAAGALAVDDGRGLQPSEAAEDALYQSPNHAAEAAAAGYLPHAAAVPQWPIAVFIASAMACMGASAAFHLFHVVDRYWFDLLARLDYSFISVLIAGSSVPFLYYGFFCASAWLTFYTSMSVATNAACLLLGLSERFRTEEWRLLRMSAFLASGLFGAIPFTHLVIASSELSLASLYLLALMGALYVTGALLYGFRIPERFYPGKFNVLFASHQIFHVAVFAACCVHYAGCLILYRWRTERTVCAVE